MDQTQLAKQLLAGSFEKDELCFLFTYDDFSAAAHRVVTLEDGEQLVRIGQQLLANAWARESRHWPGNA